MPSIFTLSDEIVSKIAAGQVVDRPASVVKELVENSLDATATQINIDLIDYGLAEIRISDNGKGISKEDLAVCYLPHTTSKISTLSDLHNIKTLGFRGEALSSIFASAEVVIKSRVAEFSEGFITAALDTSAPRFDSIGMAVGTVVTVSNLFKKVPARAKFLKSGPTELKHVIAGVEALSLAHPHVGFKVSHNGKSLMDLSKNQTLITRIQDLYGTAFCEKLIPFRAEHPRFTVSGYVSKPQLNFLNSQHQFVFVNLRPIRSALVSRSIKMGYKTLLEPSCYPASFLNIIVDPGLVDININPQKTDCRFWDDDALSSWLTDLVSQTLQQHDLVFVYSEENQDKKASFHTYNLLKDHTPSWDISLENSLDPLENNFQLLNTYIAYPSKEGLVLVDQHAAHESILFEEFSAVFAQESSLKDLYTLDTPVVMHLLPHQFNFLQHYPEILQSSGIVFDDFGSNTIRITAVPALIKSHNIQSLISELLEDIVTPKAQIDSQSLKTIEFLSCRTAIKAGEKLSKAQRNKILEKLSNSRHLYTCPHGRPLKIVVTHSELARLFKRIK